MRLRSASAALTAFAFSLALAAPHAVAGDDFVGKHPWDGFGVGSYVHQKSTTTMSGIPGMENAPPQVSEMKQTLVKVTDDAYVVKNEMKMGEEWQGSEIPYPRKGTADDKTPKPEDLGTEKVTVEGKEIDCKKQRMVIEGTTTVSWTNEKYGLVKSETTAGDSSTTQLLTKLSGKTKLGSVEVEYRELSTTVKGPMQNSKGTSWYSDAVPGGVIRSELSNEMQGGMKTSTVTETVAFEKK